MSTHIAWFSSQNSYHFIEPHEESSQLPLKINQNSISFFGARHSYYPRSQQSKSLFNIQAVFESQMGKSWSLLNRQEVLNLQILNEFNNAPNPGDSLPESESQIQQTSKEMEELGSKKGLKNLAKLLIRTLKKKKFDSSRYLTEEIEEKLMKGKKISKNVIFSPIHKQHIRQSKNIRRRTYDALNVMIAANVLGPDLTFIKRVNSESFTKKCALIIGQKNQFQTKIITTTERISKKKEFLQELKQKKESLRWWMKQKKIESDNSSTHQQSQNYKFEKKPQNIKGKSKNKKITLPVVVIADNEFEDSRHIVADKQGVVKVKYQNAKVKIFSDIDCFSILKRSQEMDQEPSETFEAEENVMNPVDNKQVSDERATGHQDYLISFCWNEE